MFKDYPDGLIDKFDRSFLLSSIVRKGRRYSMYDLISSKIVFLTDDIK
jgi:hypothetical protein